MTGLQALDNSLGKTKEWIKEVQSELGLESQEDAYSALRAVIQTLRDRLPVEEAADFAAQLPLILRGTYYEGWRPAHKPEKFHTPEDFFQRVEVRMGPRIDHIDAERVTRAVLGVIERRVASGELDNVKDNLPESLLGMFPVLQR